MTAFNVGLVGGSTHGEYVTCYLHQTTGALWRNSSASQTLTAVLTTVMYMT